MKKLIFQGLTWIVGTVLLVVALTLKVADIGEDIYWFVLLCSVYANGLSLGRAFGGD